jgi:hypothetical protein
MEFPVQKLQEEEKETLIDTLPYVEENLLEDSETSRKVASLLEQELSQVKKKKWEEQQTQGFLANTLVGIEVQRMEDGLPSEYENPFTRYEVSHPNITKQGDLNTLEKTILQQQTSLEHDMLCLANLELLKRYGTQSWLLFINQLERQVERYRIRLKEEKQRIDEINVRRRNLQQGAQKKLSSLDNSWKQLIQKNKQIEEACNHLKVDIERLKETS